jgi:hypothetical protein
MSDRAAALTSAALVGVMLVAAGWRVIGLDDWTTLVVQGETRWPSLLLFAFPACGALVVGSLYWDSRGASADDARTRPWRRWGKPLSIGYCGGLLLLQGVLIVGSLDLGASLDLSAIGGSLGVLLVVVSLRAINQMPKLPWFEGRFAPGGELGPIYGPRYVRSQSRIVVVFMIAVIGHELWAPPALAWRSAGYVLLTTALLVVCSIAWRWHLGRKWKLEQSAAGAMEP